MDSNRQFIDSGKLWKNLTIVPCNKTQDLRTHLHTTDLTEYDIIFIHVGVNNIDTVKGKAVANDLLVIMEKLCDHYPSLKIIISEVTPRQKFRDAEVQECNSLLHTSLRKLENVTMAIHSNLRNETWSFHKKDDDKHLSEISIALFAANLKVALRKALGLPSNKNIKKKNPGGGDDNRNRTKNNSNNNNNNNNNLQSFKRDLIQFLTSYGG